MFHFREKSGIGAAFSYVMERVALSRGKEKLMNIRKLVDYTEMYAGIDALMVSELSQMELYCGIGRVVSERPEKGAAVAAAEYLQEKYPDASGFSPRNLRRMRELYRTYKNDPILLDEVMKIGWTQNVVILESNLELEVQSWYIRACRQFGWSKQELLKQINDKAHETVQLSDDRDNMETKVNTSTSKLCERLVGYFFTSKFLKYMEYLRHWRRRCLSPPLGQLSTPVGICLYTRSILLCST